MFINVSSLAIKHSAKCLTGADSHAMLYRGGRSLALAHLAIGFVTGLDRSVEARNAK
jgi:hypothetical protein